MARKISKCSNLNSEVCVGVRVWVCWVWVLACGRVCGVRVWEL